MALITDILRHPGKHNLTTKDENISSVLCPFLQYRDDFALQFVMTLRNVICDQGTGGIFGESLHAFREQRLYEV